jgi:hypothetical protein
VLVECRKDFRAGVTDQGGLIPGGAEFFLLSAFALVLFSGGIANPPQDASKLRRGNLAQLIRRAMALPPAKLFLDQPQPDTQHTTQSADGLEIALVERELKVTEPAQLQEHMVVEGVALLGGDRGGYRSPGEFGKK